MTQTQFFLAFHCDPVVVARSTPSTESGPVCICIQDAGREIKI